MRSDHSARGRAGCLLRSPAHGFALLEVLIAVLLLAFAATGWVGGLTLALRAQHSARDLYQAVALVADLGEELRARPPASREQTAARWQTRAAARMSPSARGTVLAVATRASRPASPVVDTWQATLQWQDKLAPQAMSLREQMGLLR
jgi:Tfp pilus assembly protein PilV